MFAHRSRLDALEARLEALERAFAEYRATVARPKPPVPSPAADPWDDVVLDMKNIERDTQELP